jgi:hypothetical protein
MQPNSITDKIPSVHAETEIPFHDSCNCCQECNVSCCFPRRVRKHKKTNKHDTDCPSHDKTANRVNDTSLGVMRKYNRKIDKEIINN